MDPEGFDADPDQPRPRPRVVDKRVSSRDPAAAPPPPPPAQEPTPAAAEPGPATQATSEPAQTLDQIQSEPGPTPEEPRQGNTPAAASAGAASQDAPAASQQDEAEHIAREIAETPSYEWVVNTAVTLANVAGTKLDHGAVADAQLAIDALGGIIEAAGPRLQEAEAPLRQTLAQLRIAYAERMAPPPSR